MKKQDIKKSSGNKNAEDKKDSPAAGTNENLPGYPHYPASEDIMNSPEEKLGLDIENPEAPLVLNEQENEEQQDPEVVLEKGNSADVTKEDLENLGEEELAMDLGDDEDLKQRLFPVDMEGKDLVVPGAELDDEQEEIGNEDEENNFYSRPD